ncbi:SusC/RagA family TonB-linked outer membrane protein [soil metagenome]
MFVVHLTYAQQRTVTGTVADDAGIPLPGVNIIIQGTTQGTQTDFDGNFSIPVQTGQNLVFSFLGFRSVTVPVTATSNVIDVRLELDAAALDEVVVTGFGMQREKKALGYSVSEIAPAAIEERSEGDLARVLSGKSAGLNINNASGLSGSATNINIRGYNTINGSNQPLFIIDGVPISNDTNNVGNFLDGNSGSSRSLDIDPNNIASVSILKGYAAATVYGSEGKNGVILITTKTGSATSSLRKKEITFTQGVFTNEIASLPDYQNTFGNGFDGAFGNFFSNWGPGFYPDGVGGYLSPGSGIAADGTIPHPYSRPNLADAFPEFQGVRIPWEASKNNVKDFFRKGLAVTTNVNIASGSQDGKYTYNFNFGHVNDEGFTPGNELTRTNFSIGGRAELTNRFTFNGTLNYVNTVFETPPVAFSSGSGAVGTGLSVFGDLFYTPRNVRLNELPFQNPITGASVYYRNDEAIPNPNWIVNNAFVNQFTNRAFGSQSVNFKINDNLNALYRVGYDIYSERNEGGQNIGANDGATLGRYQSYTNLSTTYDHNIMILGAYDLTEDLGLNFTAGATSKYEAYDRDGVTSTGQIVFDVFRHFNFTEQSPVQFSSQRNIVGVYGQADFDFRNYLYINLAARNDWVSNQIENTKFYPSASISFLPTAAFQGITSQGGLNFLKLRAGYGTSAGFASGFPVANTLVLTPRQFISRDGVLISSNTTANQLGNAELRPELFEEIEVGLETRFLDRRVNLDFSYYSRTTTDLITSRPLPASTGFTSTQFNIGRMEGWGIEVDLGLHLVRAVNNGFDWNVNTNFTKYRSTVIDLGLEQAEGSDSEPFIVYEGFTNLGNAAFAGQPFQTMIGSSVKRDDNGNPVVNSQGIYVTDVGPNIIGDATPDFLLNVNNSMSFKNINFNFLVSYTHGGDIYSETIGTLLGRGLTTDTEDRLDTYILPGVKEDGTPNNIQINNSTYYFDVLGLQGPDELKVYDGSVIRLQEISLGYNIPQAWLERTPFGALSITAAGYNLYYNAFNTPEGVNFDPNVIGTGVGNGRGFDFINGPSGKRYGFTLKATF